MALMSDLLADLNDRIDDVSNTQLTEATKIRYINHGINAMWPKVYRTVVDTSIVLALDTYEYPLPAIVGDRAMLTRVDIQQGTPARFYQLEDFTVLPMQEGKVLVLDRMPSLVGSTIRVVSAKRVSPLLTVGATYDGPPGTEEIPVWYALGLVMDRRHENRIDYTRFSTVAAENGVDINEVMNSAQFCFAQFELLLDRAAMPLPAMVG